MNPETRARSLRILSIAGPIVGGMVSQTVLNLVDTAMVGTLGRAALAGVGIGSFANFMAVASITGLSSAVQAMAARRVGEGRESEAAASLHVGLAISLVVGLPASMLLIYLAPTLFPYLVDDPDVVAEGVPYLQARLAAMVFVGANFAFRGFWNGVDRSRLYFRTLVFMHLANIVISYVLIFGGFGVEAMGAQGAGVGTAISTALGTGSYVVLGLLHGRSFGFLAARPTLDSIGTLLRLAVPSAIQQFLFAAGYTAMFTIIGHVGTAELAAAQVLVNLTMVAILPGLGMGLAAATLVGQALGRKEPDDAKRWGWDVVRVAFVIMTLLGVPMWATPELVLGIFLPTEPEVIAIARGPLMLVGLTIWLDAFGMVLLNALLGAGAARSVMMVSVGLQWGLFLPTAYLVGPVLGGGLLAIWFANVGLRALQAGIFTALWKKGDWARIVV